MLPAQQNAIAAALGQAIAQQFPVLGTISADGAVPIDRDGIYLITKGSAAALTVAAPGSANIGRVIILLTGSDFAHVATFTGTTLQDGTAGANLTATFGAVQGASLAVIGVTATKWNVMYFNVCTIAP